MLSAAELRVWIEGFIMLVLDEFFCSEEGWNVSFVAVVLAFCFSGHAVSLHAVCMIWIYRKMRKYTRKPPFDQDFR